MRTFRCPRCSKDRPANLRSTKGTYCKSCAKIYDREWYQKNKKAILKRISLTRAAWKKKIIEFVRDLKKDPCRDCHRSFHFAAMDFDHRSNKKFNIADMARRGYSQNRILAEIKKCDLVCAVCHRIRTYQRAVGKLVTSLILD